MDFEQLSLVCHRFKTMVVISISHQSMKNCIRCNLRLCGSFYGKQFAHSHQNFKWVFKIIPYEMSTYNYLSMLGGLVLYYLSINLHSIFCTDMYGLNKIHIASRNLLVGQIYNSTWLTKLLKTLFNAVNSCDNHFQR